MKTLTGVTLAALIALANPEAQARAEGSVLLSDVRLSFEPLPGSKMEGFGDWGAALPSLEPDYPYLVDTTSASPCNPGAPGVPLQYDTGVEGVWQSLASCDMTGAMTEVATSAGIFATAIQRETQSFRTNTTGGQSLLAIRVSGSGAGRVHLSGNYEGLAAVSRGDHTFRRESESALVEVLGTWSVASASGSPVL